MPNLAPDLPAGFGEPLHLLEPPTPLPWEHLLAIVLLLTVLWAYRRWRRRPPRPTPAVEPALTISSPGGFFEAALSLRRHHGQQGSLREGCHRLAALLRRYIAEAPSSAPGPPPSTLTSEELGQRLEDPLLSSTFELLEELQFRRRAPSKTDFHGIFDLAGEALARPSHGPVGTTPTGTESKADGSPEAGGRETDAASPSGELER